MARSLNVLLIEDNDDDAELVLHELRRSGYQPVHERVWTAESMAAALQHRAWDVVISDHNMPQFDSTSAMNLLRAQGVDVPFIIVSGRVEEEAAVMAMRAGAHDYMTKGNLGRLLPAITRELREAQSRRERRETERALREAEEVFRALSSSSPLGIFTTDTQGNVTYANPNYRAIFGLTLMEAGGAGWVGALHPEDRERVSQAWNAFVQGGGRDKYVIECRVQPRAGKIAWIQGNAFAMRADDGQPTGYVGTVEDITERKELEQQLRQAQKVEAVGRLAGGIAHDFNNILTAVLGYSDLILRSARPDDPVRHNVDEIRKAAERAAALTGQLLAFSRKQVMETKVFDFRQVVSGLEKMLQRLIGENVQLITELGDQRANVKADPGQIEQVIMNLIVNGRDAMPQGGKITIQLMTATLDEEYTHQQQDISPGEYVLLMVTDSGTGMTDEVKAHVFEPFFTTKPLGQGTGLGLATCYGIIKQSGGLIVVQSELGRGTTFKIYLPRVAATTDEPPKPKEFGSLPTGNEIVLLVEDEVAVRGLANLVLRDLGYQILMASNGEEALQLVAAHPQEIDLLLTDLVMPQMGGRELAERVCALEPRIKVLYTSGYTGDATVQEGLLNQTRAFLQKPYGPAALAGKIREVLDS